MRGIRRSWEWLFGRWQEGPEPPVRFREYVVAWANAHRTASRLEWARAAVHFVEQAYRSGYVRGVESRERMGFSKAPDPDAAADAIDPNWRFAPSIDLIEEAGPVTDDDDESFMMGRSRR